MGDPASPWGWIGGHNGGGPCYSASAFHAIDLGGASVCVIAAIENFTDECERVVFEVLDHLEGLTPHGALHTKLAASSVLPEPE